MPLGASRLNTLAKYVAAGGGGGADYSSSLSITSYADLGFAHYRTSYMGTTSGGDPMFAHIYKEAVGTAAIKIVAFSIDLSDGTVTEGTPYETGYLGYQAPSMVSENQHAGRDSTESNYGVISYYYNSTIKCFGFSVDPSDLSITLGSVQSLAAADSGNTGLAYCGYDTSNSRHVYAVFYRMSGGTRRLKLLGRTTSEAITQLTQDKDDTSYTSGATDMAVGFSMDNTNNRIHMVHLADYSGLAGSEGSVWASQDYQATSASFDHITRSELFGGRSTTTTETSLVSLAIDNKALGFQYNSSDTDIRAQVIQTNRSTGTPTATIGSYITLSGDAVPRGFSPGVADNEAYYLYDSSGSVAWRQITASGTTLTEGAETVTSIDTTDMTGSSIFCAVEDATYGTYIVGVIDDSTSNSPIVAAIQVEA